MSGAPVAPTVATPPHARTRLRPEIQGLRALAVVLVLAYHLWPNRLTGGYVGVDVFFVISGFLITAHLHRELASTGRVVLTRFWARRIRRLLPAALLVLVVSGVAVVVLAPPTTWAQTAREVLASALYVQNWVLAAGAVDYMAADRVPTVAQHYWSLSVEEQFYVVWPLLLLALAWWGRRRGAAGARPLATGLAVVAVGSFVWSVLASREDQALAYFLTPVRVWEFAAGGVLAVLAGEAARPGGRVPDGVRGAVGLAGLVAVVGSAVLLDDASAFPGWVAAPAVLGTVALLWAGPTRGWWTPAPWLSLRPATFVGDVSYAVYLWHWPLVVLLPYVTGAPLRTVDKLVVAAASVLLAWLTKVLVEDPARFRPLFAAAPWRSFAFAGAGMAVVLAGSLVLLDEMDRRAERGAELLAQARAAGCYGPEALDPANGCASVTGVAGPVPPAEVVALENDREEYPGCQAAVGGSAVPTCVLGPDGTPTRVVALVGDSHATQWFPAFEELARTEGWRVHTFTKASCPFTTALREVLGEQGDDAARSCRAWVDDVTGELLTLDGLDLVVTAARTGTYTFAPDGSAGAGGTARAAGGAGEAGVAGFRAAWEPLLAAGLEVAVLSDVPLTQGTLVPHCLAANDDPLACAVPRNQALPPSVLEVAADGVRGVGFVDLDDGYCDADWCYPLVGDVIVFRDASHLSAAYARALAPRLAHHLRDGPL